MKLAAARTLCTVGGAPHSNRATILAVRCTVTQALSAKPSNALI